MSLQRCQPLAASPPSNVAALDLSKSPQEMLKIFRDTQTNMIELNKSRLAAPGRGQGAACTRVAAWWGPAQPACTAYPFDTCMPALLLKHGLCAEAEVQELEQDAYEGKRQPLESPRPAPLHNEPGVYVPQVRPAAMPST